MHQLRKTATGIALLSIAFAGLPNEASAQRLERGAILVATPSLGDTSFVESVVLVLDHSDENGSIGLIINRPTNLTPSQVFPDTGTNTYDGTVFYGGPVTPTRAFLLLRQPSDADPEERLVPILDGVYLSGGFESLAALDAASQTSSRVRIYAGHARWGPGQLDAELAAGAWTLARSNAGLVFRETPLGLWQELQASTTRQEIVRAD